MNKDNLKKQLNDNEYGVNEMRGNFVSGIESNVAREDYDDDDISLSEEYIESLIADETEDKTNVHEETAVQKDAFSDSYMTKATISMLPFYLIYKGDLSKGFSVDAAKEMNIEEAIAYAFHFATLKPTKRNNDEYEAARDFIIRTIQNNESGTAITYAKTAFYFFFNGYIEAITKRFYSYIQNSDKREELVANGIQYVWAYIYDKKIKKYEGQVSVTTFFGAFINSWLEECNADLEGSSRNQYRQDRRVKAARDELLVELKRNATLVELIFKTDLGIHQVQDSLARINHKETTCSLEGLVASENFSVDDVTKESQNPYDNPEDTVIKNETLDLLYRALNSLNEIDRTVYLSCNGMEMHNGVLEYTDIENVNKDINPTKQFARIANLLKMPIHDVERSYQRADKKIREFCNIRKNVKKEFITSQEALLSFNKEKDDEWTIEFHDLSNFRPD